MKTDLNDIRCTGAEPYIDAEHDKDRVIENRKTDSVSNRIGAIREGGRMTTNIIDKFSIYPAKEYEQSSLSMWHSMWRSMRRSMWRSMRPYETIGRRTEDQRDDIVDDSHESKLNVFKLNDKTDLNGIICNGVEPYIDAEHDKDRVTENRKTDSVINRIGAIREGGRMTTNIIDSKRQRKLDEMWPKVGGSCQIMI